MLSRGCRLLLLFLVLLYGVQAGAATLQNLRYNRMPDKVQLVLDLDHPTVFRQSASPGRRASSSTCRMRHAVAARA